MNGVTLLTPMPQATRRQRKRDRTATHMSATAYGLFEQHGYEAVSMEQIAAAADVAKATLYKYFPVKEALLAHRFREDVAAGMAERAAALSAQAQFDARMRYLLRESAVWHAARRRYLPHYLRFLTSQAHYSSELRCDSHLDSGTWQILTLLFRDAQAAGEVRASPTAEEIAWSFQYLLFAAMSAWLIDPSRDLSDRFLSAFDLTMHGVASAQSEVQARST